MSLSKMLHKSDGGYASRKLWFSVGTSVGILAVGMVAAFLPAFRPSLEVVVGGLLGVLAIYSGANVGGKLAIGKAGKYLTDGSGEEAEPPKPVAKKKTEATVEPLPPE